ncbi:unnamed protein product [Phaedon cochleariae]|uniref:Uncharacterized protein n=1 Tax=Phaedon cochleariae TaxID=80249 RepID=A0A9N9SDE1_PHACE|nr:unnamed protein product [Phaedon cochleariae]
MKDIWKSNKHMLGAIELTMRGDELCRSMSAREKSPYVNISKKTPRFKMVRSRRRRRRRSRKRSRRGRRRRRSSSSSMAEESVERYRKQKKDRSRERSRKDKKSDEANKSKILNERVEKKSVHKFGECDRRKEDGEYRLKSADYDDIRRDYI